MRARSVGLIGQGFLQVLQYDLFLSARIMCDFFRGPLAAKNLARIPKSLRAPRLRPLSPKPPPCSLH